MIGFILGCSLSLPINSAHAQKAVSAFDSIYTHAATTLSGTDIHKAIQVADSLLEHSENNVQRMKSLMLLATLKGRIGDITEALSRAMQAETIAQKDHNYEWQVRIAGFLSTTFRQVNLTSEAQKYLGIAEKANMRTDSDSPNYPIIQSFIHQEKAYYRIVEKDYQGAIEELRQAEDEIYKSPENARSALFLGTNYQLLGACFIGLEDYGKAKKYFDLALEELRETETELKAFVYTGQGEAEMLLKDYNAAYGLFKKAEAYIETSVITF